MYSHLIRRIVMCEGACPYVDQPTAVSQFGLPAHKIVGQNLNTVKQKRTDSTHWRGSLTPDSRLSRTQISQPSHLTWTHQNHDHARHQSDYATVAHVMVLLSAPLATIVSDAGGAKASMMSRRRGTLPMIGRGGPCAEHPNNERRRWFAL
jgi:hypothetical protein